MIKKEFDIVIVGAGLVGLSFANLLSSRLISSETIYGDKKIAILEKQPFKAPDLSNSFDSRVVALTQSSRIFLEDIGIWGKIVRERVCPFERMEIWESDGTGHIEFDCNDVRQDSLGYIVENSLVVRCLLNQVKKLKNVEFICPATVSDVQKNIYPGQSATSDITLNDGSVITTKLLVAADGGDSRIRDLCGFQMQEMNYGHQSIVARIATEKKHNFTARQRFLPDGPLALLPIQIVEGNSNQCSIVWSQKNNIAEKLMLLDDLSFCKALEQASGGCLGKIIKVEKRTKYKLILRHANDYIMQGVALIGDSAHTMHPLAGQGVNLGIQDALALTEEIEHALSRGLSPGDEFELRRYQRKRKPHNLAMITIINGLKMLFEEKSLPIRALRNDGMTALNRIGFIKNKIVRESMVII
jgi:2-octaprenylphenol hydroxylase